MSNLLIKEFSFILIYLLVGLGFAVTPIIISYLIGPLSGGAKRDEVYECGVETIGTAWVQFGITYYLFALIFLAFDVDVLYLFPVVVAFGKDFVIRDFIEIVIFLGILSLAIVYAWRKGVFNWTMK